eukprot:2124173-Amphidinium_carterae.1
MPRHNVETVTGDRRALIMELWDGPRNTHNRCALSVRKEAKCCCQAFATTEEEMKRCKREMRK